MSKERRENLKEKHCLPRGKENRGSRSRHGGSVMLCCCGSSRSRKSRRSTEETAPLLANSHTLNPTQTSTALAKGGAFSTAPPHTPYSPTASKNPTALVAAVREETKNDDLSTDRDQLKHRTSSNEFEAPATPDRAGATRSLGGKRTPKKKRTPKRIERLTPQKIARVGKSSAVELEFEQGFEYSRMNDAVAHARRAIDHKNSVKAEEGTDTAAERKTDPGRRFNVEELTELLYVNRS
jgi:hypothetical protein